MYSKVSKSLPYCYNILTLHYTLYMEKYWKVKTQSNGLVKQKIDKWTNLQRITLAGKILVDCMGKLAACLNDVKFTMNTI